MLPDRREGTDSDKTDLNSNGSNKENVAMVHSFDSNQTRVLSATGSVFNYDLNAGFFAYEEGSPVWSHALQIEDAASGAKTDTGLRHRILRAAFGYIDSIVMSEHGIAWLPDERFTLSDLNGDGDQIDKVVHVFDAKMATSRNTKLEGLAFRCGGPRTTWSLPRRTTMATALSGSSKPPRGASPRLRST